MKSHAAALRGRSQVAVRAARSLLTACTKPGCSTMTMGGTCVEHDMPSLVVYPRGRPFPALQPARSPARRT